MAKLVALAMVFAFALIVILVFAVIYNALGEGSFYLAAFPDRSQVTFGEAMWTSVSNSTLCGVGDITPRSDAARGWFATQVAITGFGLVYLFASAASEAADKNVETRIPTVALDLDD